MEDWPYSSDNCSVARALSVVGEKWTLLIMREAFFGVRRFREFRTHLGIAPNLLATRLDTLVEMGVMDRVPYQELGDRQRHEYRLTDRGHDLMPILIALLQWGDQYLADPDGPSVIVRHHTGPDESSCDQPVHVVMECAGGHAPLRARALLRTPGPGARPADSSSPDGVG
jgi:DNA-binding HxlR family transcriptional regulator